MDLAAQTANLINGRWMSGRPIFPIRTAPIKPFKSYCTCVNSVLDMSPPAIDGPETIFPLDFTV